MRYSLLFEEGGEEHAETLKKVSVAYFSTGAMYEALSLAVVMVKATTIFLMIRIPSRGGLRIQSRSQHRTIQMKA